MDSPEPDLSALRGLILMGFQISIGIWSGNRSEAQPLVHIGAGARRARPLESVRGGLGRLEFVQETAALISGYGGYGHSVLSRPPASTGDYRHEAPHATYRVGALRNHYSRRPLTRSTRFHTNSCDPH